MPNAKKKSTKPPVRPRRRQAKSTRGNNQAVNRSNTINSVQSGLRTTGRNNVRTNFRNAKVVDIGYARCRLDPFNSGPSMGLPDSNATNKLVFDHRSVQDFIVNGSASLLILPTLPFGAAIKPDTAATNTITIDGSNYTQATTSGQSINWIPIAYYNDMIPGGAINLSPTDNITPVISSRCRIVGVGYRLTCTSPSTSIAGIIEVCDSEIAVEDRQYNDITTTMTNGGDGAGIQWQAISIETAKVNMQLNERFQATISRTTQFRPEMCPQGVLKHAGPYLWKNIPERPTVPVSSYNYGNCFFTFGGGANVGKYGTVFEWDSSYSAKRIRINSPSPVSYRLETVICVEYILAPNNPFSRIATPKVKVDTKSVELVDAAIASMPSAVTPAQNNSFVNRFFATVSKAAPIVGGGFGPAGMAIGTGVAAITDAIANLL